MDIEDHRSLIEWLRSAGWIDPDECPTVTTLAGGVSNRTVLVQRVHGADGDWVIKQGLEKLRVQADWFCDPARVHREAEGLRWLEKILPAGSVPRFVGEDHRFHLLLMQAVPQPHVNWKTKLLAGEIDLDECRQFGQLLGTIHAKAFQQRDVIAPLFDDRSYFEALRLEPYYAYAASQVSAAATFLNRLLDETRNCRLTLVHGDYSPKNILVRDGQLVLLDHEVIHWGDPAFDVGFGLTHLVSKAHHLPQHRKQFAEAAQVVWDSYLGIVHQQLWSKGLDERAARHLLGCLLARVAGRSPLEYLTDEQRRMQGRVVVQMMDAEPGSVDGVIDSFLQKV